MDKNDLTESDTMQDSIICDRIQIRKLKQYNEQKGKSSNSRKLSWNFPGGSEGKVSACNVGDLGLIPGSGKSPGEENINPLQYSCLENLMEGEAW